MCMNKKLERIWNIRRRLPILLKLEKREKKTAMAAVRSAWGTCQRKKKTKKRADMNSTGLKRHACACVCAFIYEQRLRKSQYRQRDGTDAKHQQNNKHWTGGLTTEKSAHFIHTPFHTPLVPNEPCYSCAFCTESDHSASYNKARTCTFSRLPPLLPRERTRIGTPWRPASPPAPARSPLSFLSPPPTNTDEEHERERRQ